MTIFTILLYIFLWLHHMAFYVSTSKHFVEPFETNHNTKSTSKDSYLSSISVLYSCFVHINIVFCTYSVFQYIWTVFVAKFSFEFYFFIIPYIILFIIFIGCPPQDGILVTPL